MVPVRSYLLTVLWNNINQILQRQEETPDVHGTSLSEGFYCGLSLYYDNVRS